MSRPLFKFCKLKTTSNPAYLFSLISNTTHSYQKRHRIMVPHTNEEQKYLNHFFPELLPNEIV